MEKDASLEFRLSMLYFGSLSTTANVSQQQQHDKLISCYCFLQQCGGKDEQEDMSN